MRSWAIGFTVLVGVAACPLQGKCHSDASNFGSADHDTGHRAHHDTRTFYPATVITDPQLVKNVVLKVNARLKKVSVRFLGERVSRGQVLAEFESAELLTLQQTFIETVVNRDAMTAFSTTGEEKLLEGRMNLKWRGLSDREIERLEQERKPIDSVSLVSPIDGTILGIDASAARIVSGGSRGGLFSSSGTTLFRVAGNDALLIEAKLPSHMAAALQAGTMLKLHVPGSKTEMSGALEQAITFENPQNRSVTVRIRPDKESAAQLISGQAVLVTLEEPTADAESGHHHD